MNIRLIFTILLSKLIIKACRLAKLGGTTFAGKLALKIYPDVPKVIAAKFKTIMVTGTNGKTTTTRIIGQILKENGLEYVTNKSGANLVSGITTTLLEAVDFLGNCKAPIALLEIDEAAFNAITDAFGPDILVVTNFFRDQLDRYGELYSTLKGVRSGIEKSQKTRLIINADDSLCASLGRDVGREVLYYGIDSTAYTSSEKIVNSDAMFCIYCKTKYEYSNHVYGHLGWFKCPECGYSRPASQVACTKIEELTSSYSKIALEIRSATYCSQYIESCKDISPKINLPGMYNIYNALAAAACGIMLNLPVHTIVSALESFECGFGRMESINANGKSIKVILVKNPTGFNQVLNFLLTDKSGMQLAFLINDKLADGTDISWLWDVDFEKLRQIQDRVEYFYTSGIRAEDMAVRLKYAGIYTNKIKIIKEYNELITTGVSKTGEGQNFYILPTYTAMLDLRKLLAGKYGLKEFWK